MTENDIQFENFKKEVRNDMLQKGYDIDIADKLMDKYDEVKKSWSGDLQKRFPNGGWRTINGSHVFVNEGKVVAGLDGFNKEIDKFFEGKKAKESKSSNKKDYHKLSNDDIKSLKNLENDLRSFGYTLDEVVSSLEDKNRNPSGSGIEFAQRTIADNRVKSFSKKIDGKWHNDFIDGFLKEKDISWSKLQKNLPRLNELLDEFKDSQPSPQETKQQPKKGEEKQPSNVKERVAKNSANATVEELKESKHGFNKEIDKFFEGKKKSSNKKEIAHETLTHTFYTDGTSEAKDTGYKPRKKTTSSKIKEPKFDKDIEANKKKIQYPEYMVKDLKEQANLVKLYTKNGDNKRLETAKKDLKEVQKKIDNYKKSIQSGETIDITPSPTEKKPKGEGKYGKNLEDLEKNIQEFINSKPDLKYKPTQEVIDFKKPKLRGMQGGMGSDFPYGKKTYVREYGELPEMKDEGLNHIIKMFPNIERRRYVNARNYGLNPFQALWYAEGRKLKDSFKTIVEGENHSTSKYNN